MYIKYLFLFLFVTFFLLSPINAQPSTLSINLSSTDTVICPDETVVIGVTISGQLVVGLTYEYDSSDIHIIKNIESNSPGFAITIWQPGIYTITRYYNNTAFDITPVTITVNPTQLPEVVLSGGGNFCESGEIEPVIAYFTGNSPWEIIYQINNGNAQIETYTNDAVVLLSEPGSVTIRRISDRYCSSEPDIISTIDVGIPVIDSVVGEREACAGNTSHFRAFTNGIFDINWVIPSGDSADSYISGYGENDVQWKIPGIFTITVWAYINGTDCRSESTVFPVTVYERPKSLQNSDTVACFQTDSVIILSPARNTENNIYWINSGETSDNISVSDTGVYFFIESIPSGCSDTGSIRVLEKCIPRIYVPEAFTPNNDGINDVLEVFGVCYNLHICIYSLSGEFIYCGSEETPWNGRYDGNELPNGTYIWKASYTDIYGGTMFFDEGFVVLIR